MKIFSVVVTYNPDWVAVQQLANRLFSAGVQSIIVDNSEVEINNKTLDREYCTLLSLGENLGIASAQNKGIDYCLEKNADIIVFFDQDSVISDEFISKLVEPIMTQNENIVAPTFIDAEKGFFYPIVSISKYGMRKKVLPSKTSPSFHTNTAISSGTAVKSTVFDIVGKMKEDLFIDYVDTEWCLRCENFGIKILILPDNQMLHSIGDKSFNIAGFTVPVHSPQRRYYRVRNSFAMLRFKHIPIILGLREVSFSLIHQLLLIITQKGKRKEYAKYGIIAVWHGIKSVKGKFITKKKSLG